jgi:guanylate kinase
MIKQKKSGQLIVISGPSGAGKDSVVSRLLETNKNIWLSISATSRSPRGKEEDGVDYYFLDKKDFEKKIKEDYFLEYAKYTDNYYGTPKAHIIDKLNKGIDVILVIEIQGAKQIKELLPETVLIFIMPPTEKDLLKRLVGRQTESKDKIISRFERAYQEINEVSKYNYVVVNDKIEDAASKVDAIIKAEKCRVDRIEEMLVSNKEELIHEFLMDEDFENKKITEKINERID